MNRKNQKNKNPKIGGKKYKKTNIMNNDKLKQILFILVVIIVLLFTTLAIVITTHRTRKQPEQKTIIISDTISKVVYDTVYIKEYKTVKFPIIDTLIKDSIRIDSVFVEVPISTYRLDTTFCTDTTNLNIHIINSGFNVSLDSLYYKLEYRQATPVLPKKNYFRDHFRFGVGVSAGYGFFSKQPDIFVGLGFYYVF